MVLEKGSVSPVAEDVIGTRLRARRAAPATARERDEAKVRTDDRFLKVSERYGSTFKKERQEIR